MSLLQLPQNLQNIFKYYYLDSSMCLPLSSRKDSYYWFFLPWNSYFLPQVNWYSSSIPHIISQAQSFYVDVLYKTCSSTVDEMGCSHWNEMQNQEEKKSLHCSLTSFQKGQARIYPPKFSLRLYLTLRHVLDGAIWRYQDSFSINNNVILCYVCVLVHSFIEQKFIEWPLCTWHWAEYVRYRFHLL